MVLFVWILCGVAGYFIGKSKGRGAAGFWLGVLLGPIGLIITFFIKENREAIVAASVSDGSMKKCPYCAELIRAEATVCRYCSKELA